MNAVVVVAPRLPCVVELTSSSSLSDRLRFSCPRLFSGLEMTLVFNKWVELRCDEGDELRREVNMSF